jgi:hypothetical protein
LYVGDKLRKYAQEEPVVFRQSRIKNKRWGEKSKKEIISGQFSLSEANFSLIFQEMQIMYQHFHEESEIQLIGINPDILNSLQICRK